MKRAKVWLIVFLLSPGIGLAPACKEGNPLSTTVSPATAEFVPVQGPPAGTERTVSIRTRSADRGRIHLDVVLTEIEEPVTGIALKLSYPAEFSKFIGCSDGDLFAVPGHCYHAEPDPGTGEVFLARSITGPGQATAVEGDSVILQVEFLVFGRGGTGDTAPNLVFEGKNLGGGDASAVLDVNGDPIQVQWFEGRLVGL